ncbi:SpoIIE family protein phosphatase [Streptomyces sp. NPDC058279]|uniref:SpoIIE family protein phosphatase n=1 Tax=Streptomyces sp. NPDC058279 TaxID=3346418 RepID=UPI0036ED4A2A
MERLPGRGTGLCGCLTALDGLHVPIGSVTVPNSGRLLMASDGAYEPLEDAQLTLADHLEGSPQRAARTLVSTAIEHGGSRADNATVLLADLDR